VPSVRAQESVLPYRVEKMSDQSVMGDFMVGPGKFELSIAPGESQEVELFIGNRMGSTRAFSLVVEDVVGSSDTEQTVVLLGNDTGPYTLKDYLQLPVTEVTLEHGQRARIPVTVSLPADTEPGGHYGSLLVSTLTRPELEDNADNVDAGTTVVSQIGTLFFVTTPGDTTTGGELKDFALVPPEYFMTSGPVHFGLLFNNTGLIHLNPYGVIEIKNMFGEIVEIVELDPWFALPQSLRLREISWPKERLFGKYTATAKVNRGYEDIVDEQSLTFFVVDWRFVTLSFGTLVMLWWLYRVRVRRKI